MDKTERVARALCMVENPDQWACPDYPEGENPPAPVRLWKTKIDEANAAITAAEFAQNDHKD